MVRQSKQESRVTESKTDYTYSSYFSDFVGTFIAADRHAETFFDDTREL